MAITDPNIDSLSIAQKKRLKEKIKKTMKAFNAYWKQTESLLYAVCKMDKMIDPVDLHDQTYVQVHGKNSTVLLARHMTELPTTRSSRRKPSKKAEKAAAARRRWRRRY